MQFQIHMGDPSDHALLLQMLDTWRRLTCVSVRLSDWSPDRDEEPDLLIWDLDTGMLPPASSGSALIFCVSCSQAAISGYSFHPVGFLRKPLSMNELTAVLLQCRNLWWDSLNRLELFSGRCRLQLPIFSLVWAEGERHGCLLHSSQSTLLSRESLSSVAQRLPQELFLRCHRSFLVNLCHIQRLESDGFHMSDGATIPLSRTGLSAAKRTYTQFCQWRDSGISIPPSQKG